MTIKQQLISELKKVLKDLGLDYITPSIDYPADPKHGDYSTNVALVAAKKLTRLPSPGGEATGGQGKNPIEFAEELRSKLESLELVEKVEVVKPGFINFWIKDGEFAKKLQEMSGKNVGDALTDRLKGKKISVEYTDPNPFKELHIGHLYSNTIGESLCLLFEANDATVWRADYFGDVGMHVAKSIWGLQSKFKVQNAKFKVMKDLEKEPLAERIKFLGEGYALGSNEYADKDDVKEEVKHLNKLIYLAAQQMWKNEKGMELLVDYRQGEEIDEKELQEVYEIYTLGRKWSLEYFETLYKRLGTKFDGYYPESIAGERGYKLVRDNIEKGIFEESEGAVIFPGEKQGLHNRVFINRLGLPTYEAKELGLSPWKYEDFPYDESYIVTANEIAGYFSVLVEALKKVNPDLGAKTHPLLHGMVKLPEGKMSSRSGNVITVASLFDEAKELVLPLVSEAVENREEVAEMVGIAAVKYAFLRSGVGKDLVFDFEESVSFDGNSGPYLQYTFARTQSVIARSEATKQSQDDGKRLPHSFQSFAMTRDLEAEERELLKLLSRFPETVGDAAERLSPNLLCTYLFELAQAFNIFYQKCPILKSEKETQQFRLFLTDATGDVLKKGLSLLGINSPEKM